MKRIRNATWLTASRLIADLLSAGLFVVIGRHFGPQGVGEYAYGFALAGFAMVFSGLGLDTYGIREFVRHPAAEGPGLLSRLLATQVTAMALTLVGLAGYLAVTHASKELGAITLLLTSYQVAAALAQTLFVPAYGREAMRLPAAAEMVCRSAAVVAASFAILVLRAPLVTALIPYAVGGLALVGIGLASATRYVGFPKLTLSWPAIRDTARLGWPFGASDIVLQLYARADLILLTLLVGQSAAGIYASSYKFVEVGAMPLVFIGLATYPGLSVSFERKESRFTHLAADLLGNTLLLGGLLAWGLYFVVPEVVVPVLGQRFAGATDIVRLMSILAVFSAVEIALMRTLLAGHRQLARLKLLVLGTGLKVALNLVMIPALGVAGAVAASVVSLFAVDLLYLRPVRDVLPARTLLRAGIPWISALAGAAAVGAMVQYFIPEWWAAAAASLTVFLSAGIAGSRLVRLAPSAETVS